MNNYLEDYTKKVYILDHISSMKAVISFSFLNIFWGLIASIQASFFPIEAASKGATATQFRGVFGIIHLAIFITSPFMGIMVTKLGLGIIFKFVLLLSCSCALTFGFLTYINETITFLVLAYILRLLESVGGARFGHHC